MIFKKYSEFQPLKEIVVGQGYPLDYFDNIEDSNIREKIQQIFFEIEEDFQNLIRTLQQFGVQVHRPGIITKQQYQAACERGRAPVPPLTPRDRQGVFGTKFVPLCDWHEFAPMHNYWQSRDSQNFVDLFGTANRPVVDGANNSCVFQMGRDVWFDESDYLTLEQSVWLEKNILTDSRYRFHRMLTEGHGDCVFAVLRPGVILTSYHDNGINYRSDFPNWKLHHVGTPSIVRQIQQDFWQFRENNHPGFVWWTPQKHNEPQFSEYVDRYLSHWLGTVHESVFDVNCLSIDQNHVIFGCYDKAVFDYCEANGITPILCDIRHRFFFDGSVHCCTLDIRREGDMEDYF